MQYQPYFQVGESASTININRIQVNESLWTGNVKRIFKWVNPYQPSISTVTNLLVDKKLIN